MAPDKYSSLPEMVQQAIDLAAKAHQGQKRASGEDYIIHPVAVMQILNAYNFPEEALVAAVLHDVTEDSPVTNRDIVNTFGERVGFIVYALSKNRKPKYNSETKKVFEQQKKQFSHLPKTFDEFVDYRFLLYINRFYTSGIADPWIFFIKMSDQIHNLSTLHPFSQKKQKRKIEEVEDYFLPIYDKAKNIITPLYMDRYNALLNRLKTGTQKARKQFLTEA